MVKSFNAIHDTYNVCKTQDIPPAIAKMAKVVACIFRSDIVKCWGILFKECHYVHRVHVILYLSIALYRKGLFVYLLN